VSDIGQEFIARSRYHLGEDFLPKIERCLNLLTDEQIWWWPNSESNSIGNLLLHLSGNARQWIVCGVGGAADAEFAQREMIPREELRSVLKQTLREVDTTLAQFEPGKLRETKTIQGLDVSVLEAILHVVEHFSMHTGQIILMTKMLTHEDLAFYEFIDSQAVMKWKTAE
jgi:uncharacterized damage-inducible protein DinB